MLALKLFLLDQFHHGHSPISGLDLSVEQTDRSMVFPVFVSGQIVFFE